MKHIFTFLFMACISLSAIAQDWKTVTLVEGESYKVRSMCAFDNNEALVAGYDSLLFKTYDGGVSWSKINMAPFYPTEEAGMDFYDASSAGDVVMLAVGKEGGYSGMIMKSEDKGETWSYIPNTAFQGLTNDSLHRFYCIEVINSTTAFAFMNWKDSISNASFNKIFKTVDGGTSWTASDTPLIEAFDGDIEFVNEDVGYFAGTSKSYVFKTTDGGDNWVDYTDDEKYSYIWGIKVLGPDEVFIMGSTAIYYSNTSDLTSQVEIPLQKSNSYDLLALDKDRVMSFHKHDNIHATSDASEGGSASWQMVGNGSLDYVRKCDLVYNDTIYALGDSKIFKIAVSDVFSGGTGVDDITNQNLSVYAQGFDVKIESDKLINEVAIYSITGREIFSGSFNSNSLSIPLAGISQGIYIVRCDQQAKKIFIK